VQATRQATQRRNPLTQRTQPKGKDANGEPFPPVEIPMPTRDAFLGDLAKVAAPLPKRGEHDDEAPADHPD
jgi:hypothetical protein